MSTTSFSAGNITLGGWVTDFTDATTDMLTPVTSSLTGPFGYDFNWTANTIGTTNFGTAGGGSQTTESPQVISDGGTGGTDLYSLTISFGGPNGTDSGLIMREGNTTVVVASGNGGPTSYTIGGAGGESADQLVADIQNLNIRDVNTTKTYSVQFSLVDVTTSSGATNWSETFQTPCYAPGTCIATPDGAAAAVEDLQIGDLVATASGTAKPVKWIGRRSYGSTVVAQAPNLRPVLIRKDALGSGLPERDLLVSPMHALFIDDVFIPAAALVNGVSILRRETSDAVEYIHVELDDHDVIFAEGVPAETFVDDNSRALFENASEYYDLYGTAESPRSFSALRIEEGYRLEAIRRRIAAHAGLASAGTIPGELAGHVERLHEGELEGWVMDRANPATPVELEVLVDGEIVATVLANRYRTDLDRAGLADGRCAFSVTMPASAESLSQIEVRRASDGGRVAVPQRARVNA